MALAELDYYITIQKDNLDILVFGNDAWTIEIKDLPYLKVGPFHTNNSRFTTGYGFPLSKYEYQQAKSYDLLGWKTKLRALNGLSHYMNSNGLDEYTL
jgi:hypothetical protein